MYATSFVQVGRNIQNILNAKGLTQQYLADALSISKQVMSKIINGHKAINVSELSKIASCLETTTDALLTVSENLLPVDLVSFMGLIQDNATKEIVELIRSAIDEIVLLEELVYE